MAKFAPIGPPHLLKRIRDEWGQEWLGDYHLVLAHDVVENERLWRDGQILPDNSLVIVDNSIIELGQPVEPKMMKEACEILGARYRKVIVLPDAFDDPQKTYDNALEWLGLYTTLYDVEYMYVVQAERISDQMTSELMRDLAYLVDKGVTWVSAPRRIADKYGTRMFLLHSLQQCKLRWPRLKIHLLGFSENIKDDLFCTAQYGVEGIDSAVPVRLGQQGINITGILGGIGAVGPRGTFWTDSHDKLHDTLKHNLLVVEDQIEYPSSFTNYQPKLNEDLI